MVTDLTPSQRVERSRQAKQALEFLEPAFAALQEAYGTRIEEISAKTPWDAQRITALANAKRIVSEVKAQIESIMHDGAEAQSGIDRARRIEELTPARRRLVEIGLV
jgi:hypothetical protein